MVDIDSLESRNHYIQISLQNVIDDQRKVEKKWTFEKLKANPKCSHLLKIKKVAVSSIGLITVENSTLQSGTEYSVKILQKEYCSAFSNPDMINLNSIAESNPEHTLCDV